MEYNLFMVNVTSVGDILRHIGYAQADNGSLIARAYEFAQKAHAGQSRHSGEPYINHSAEVALILAKFGMSADTVAAGLLHDVLEDTSVSAEEFQFEFGEQILFLVEGVTKLGAVRYYGSDRHNESLRKLFVATSQDIRVLIIKLADRLHNMQTLQFVPEKKQVRIARETLEIYVPIAHRLGMGRLRRELEDLAFPFLYPVEYQRVVEQKKSFEKRVIKTVEETCKNIKDRLLEVGLIDFYTSYSIKGSYSLYNKLKEHDWNLDHIYDYVSIYVVVESAEQCYQVLGIINNLWRPIPKQVKDYIAFPKPSGYRSLHTAVLTPAGNISEIKIRTEAMHREAELGIISHIRDIKFDEKEGDSLIATKSWFRFLIPSVWQTFSSRQSEKNLDVKKILYAYKDGKLKMPEWIQEIVREYKIIDGEKESYDGIKGDFFSYRIFVFTPEGDVVDLPTGASSIDFAYAIHSDIGNHTSGALVNQKLSSLDTELNNGDIVEIITDKITQPTEEWLGFTKTSIARRHIRTALSTQNQIEDLENLGTGI